MKLDCHTISAVATTTRRPSTERQTEAAICVNRLTLLLVRELKDRGKGLCPAWDTILQYVKIYKNTNKRTINVDRHQVEP